jgi:probable HAF family extracellular repeat protein
MPTPWVLFHSSLLLFRRLLLSAMFLAIASAAQAQTQASCSFSFFQTTFFTPPLSQFGQFFPFGINDFGSVVGGAFQTGFIRWANGGFTFPSGTSSLTSRNDKGTSLGYDSHGNGIILTGTSVSSAAVTIGANTYNGLGVSFVGINNWGSVVGLYGDSSGIAHGFKRWSNGKGFVLNYPASFKAVNSGTFPTAINDNGVIVGFTQIPYHAFVYHNGKWATLQYPNANSTLLSGVSNAGVIVGNAGFADGSTKGFLYKNGAFEVISPPNSVGPGAGSGVIGISLGSGLILGFADLPNSARQGYIAKCN